MQTPALYRRIGGSPPDTAELHRRHLNESFRGGSLRFFDAGDKVVAFLHTYARGRSSGVDVEVPVAHVLTFANGKCLGYVSYHDRAEALRVAGLED